MVIIKPSTAYGPMQVILRQICWDFPWIDRTKQGKPVIICGDGFALHQHLHVDAVAQAFVGVIGKEHTPSQTYNAVNRGYISWLGYHQLAGKILAKDVELVGVPFEDWKRLNIPDMGILEDEFAYEDYYSSEKLFRDVTEFHPRVALEQGMTQVFEVMEREGRIPNSDEVKWEDEIAEKHKRLWK